MLRLLLGLVVRTARDSLRDRVPGLTAEVALFALLSLPALLLVVLGSLGWVAGALGPDGAEQLDRLVFDLPRTFLSEATYDAYAGLARTVLADGRADVVSVGALLSLWTGSRAVTRALETVSLAYDVEPRPGWRRRLLALVVTVAGLLGALAVLPLLVLGPRLVDLLAPDQVADATLSLLGTLYWPALAVLLVTGLATFFHVGVPWSTPWHRDLPGAVLAMVAWFAAAAGLRAYLALTTRDDTVYQQLAVPIAVVLWLYVSAAALLLGAELNAEVERTWPTSDRSRGLRERDGQATGLSGRTPSRQQGARRWPEDPAAPSRR